MAKTLAEALNEIGINPETDPTPDPGVIVPKMDPVRLRPDVPSYNQANLEDLKGAVTDQTLDEPQAMREASAAGYPGVKPPLKVGDTQVGLMGADRKLPNNLEDILEWSKSKPEAASKAPMAQKDTQEPNWNDLQNQLQGAQQRAGMSRAVQQGFQAVSPDHGFRADPNAGSEEIASAKVPLEMAQARQNYQREAAQTSDILAQEQSRLAASKLAESERDPNSPSSMRQKEFIKKFFGDTGLPVGALDGLSAADIKGANGDIMGMLKIAAEKQKAEAHKKHEEDPMSPDNVAWRAALEHNPRYKDAVTAAKAEGVWDALTQKTGEDQRKSWDSNIEDQIHREQNTATNNLAQAQFGEHKKEAGLTQDEKKGKLLEPIVEAETTIAQLDALRDSEGALPGIGKWPAVKQYVDSTFGSHLSDPKEIEARKLLNQAYLAARRATTGVAFSPREEADIKAAGIDPNTSDPRQVEIALKIMQAKLKAQRANIESSFGGATVPTLVPAAPKDHGKVVKETARVRTYADGFKELIK